MRDCKKIANPMLWQKIAPISCNQNCKHSSFAKNCRYTLATGPIAKLWLFKFWWKKFIGGGLARKIFAKFRCRLHKNCEWQVWCQRRILAIQIKDVKWKNTVTITQKMRKSFLSMSLVGLFSCSRVAPLRPGRQFERRYK